MITYINLLPEPMENQQAFILDHGKTEDDGQLKYADDAKSYGWNTHQYGKLKVGAVVLNRHPGKITKDRKWEIYGGGYVDSISKLDDKGNVIFPEGCEDIEKNYLHKINHWYGDHCVRRFTTAYYDARIDILSPATIKARNDLDNKINAIRNSLPEGPTRTDLLPVNKQRELLRLER